MQLNDLKHPALTLSATLDGYRVEIEHVIDGQVVDLAAELKIAIPA